MEPVRNHRNRNVVEAARLHRARVRKERGETLIEGPHLLDDAERAGADIRQVFCTPENPVDGGLMVDERALQRLSGTDSPRGPVAVIGIPDSEPVGDRNMVVSVGVSDPGNVGSLIRTAASFHWAFGYLEGTADPWAPKVLRSGAGGQFQTPVVALDSLPDMVTVATVVSGGSDPSSVSEGSVALLIGEEASGLDQSLVDDADYQVTIPTTGPTESLNAGVAAGILVYALSNR